MFKFLLLIVVALITICLTSYACAVDYKTYIPPQAFTYKGVIQSELDTYFPSIPEYNYVPSLIEHESCISLTHSRCWNSKSELRTKRELGIGLGMVTVAYNPDGSIRFDTLKELKNNNKEALKDLYWENIYQRPDLQIRALILLVRNDYTRLRDVPDAIERLKMTDSAYNGGLGGLFKERRACGIAANCDPNIWDGHVEVYCLKSKKVLYGNRSPAMINRDHVRDTFYNKLPKYRKQYFAM